MALPAAELQTEPELAILIIPSGKIRPPDIVVKINTDTFEPIRRALEIKKLRIARRNQWRVWRLNSYFAIIAGITRARHNTVEVKAAAAHHLERRNPLIHLVECPGF